MKVSEFIKRLQEFQQEHGDLEVETHSYIGRVIHKGPSLAHRKVLRGRESRPEFAGSYEPERRGEPVCCV